MKTKECACKSGDRCNSVDEDGTYCADMKAVEAYWRNEWNNASPSERMTQMQIDAELIDAGRGHLVRVS